MAKKENPSRLRAIIGDENANKMGNYMESTGGGTPLEKGEKLKDHPEAKRVQQPRDENGQFTYNSVNFKERKYKYHGDGDTIPPFLRGVNLSYFVKKDTEINYNNKIYLSGIKMSADEIIERLKEYKKGEGFGKKLEERIKGKPGRRSNVTRKKIEEGKKGVLDDKTDEVVNITTQEMIEKLKAKWNEVKGKRTSPKSFKRKNAENVDFKLAKNNPSKFAEKYKNEIEKIVKLSPKLNADLVIEVMASGKFKTFKELKDALKGI